MHQEVIKEADIPKGVLAIFTSHLVLHAGQDGGSRRRRGLRGLERGWRWHVGQGLNRIHDHDVGFLINFTFETLITLEKRLTEDSSMQESSGVKS